ncbi:MAG: hypothetical protein EB127_05270 [Alphaproteobacteria bacterium]|nr:hypothetical protein [Alphaproteobacteria bacterium]
MITGTIFSFFLILARISALFTLIPCFADDRIPLKIRMMLAILTSFCSIPFINEYLPPYTTSSSLIAYYIVSEMLVGIMLGLSARILFSALLIVGNIVSMQSGLSAATIYDPSQKEQVALFGSFISVFSIIIMFTTDSHHLFIAGFLESYKKFQPGLMIDIGDASNQISLMVSMSFALAFKIGAPFIIVGTSMLVASGVLSRLMPTFQVFFVITPMQILVMFMVLIVVINQMIFIVIESMMSIF